MINIADILKDCPKGTKLYSPICGECRLIKIYEGLGFDVINDTDDVFNFSYDGRYNLNGECCIFPSKENRDWTTYQKPFKDGDILTYIGNYTTTFIYCNKDNEPHLATSFYVACNNALSHNFLIYNKYTLIVLNENCDVRLATEDEKIKLFDAIKTNGYKWNAETKTLEKLIIPKFKVGDIITNGKVTIKIGHIDDEYYYDITRNIANRLFIKFQDEWELAPVPKFKVGDIIKAHNPSFVYKIINITDTHYTLESMPGKHRHNILICKDEDWELTSNKFNISTLKAYDKVLVRDDNNSAWINTFFGFYDTVTNKKYPFIAEGVKWAQCIPYEGNEHLLGTCDECDEYYKNW